MLETRFKIAMLLAVVFLTSLPVMGILRGTTPPPQDPLPQKYETRSGLDDGMGYDVEAKPIPEELIHIEPGYFDLGTMTGGFDEKPQRKIYLDGYFIDKFEVTNHQYLEFSQVTGHRKPGPPARYAKNLVRMRGPNQPVVYVSWEDADAYCRWKGRRLPTEVEWEKAMRGTDGRRWPWGSEPNLLAANWGHLSDGFEVAAPVGSFPADISPFGVADGAGNVMEWVADWYGETIYSEASERNPQGPEHGMFRVLRGGGYTTAGNDVRITSRSKMVPDFRDETIGFRCAVSDAEIEGGTKRGSGENITGNQSNRG